MKSVLLALVFIGGSAFALPSRQECTAKETLATKNVRTVEDRFNVGEVTRVDVLSAELSLLEIKLACASIVRGDVLTVGSYCEKANLDKARDYVIGMKEEASIGQRTTAEVQRAELDKVSMEAVCAP
jgi:hypothetical protein